MCLSCCHNACVATILANIAQNSNEAPTWKLCSHLIIIHTLWPIKIRYSLWKWYRNYIKGMKSKNILEETMTDDIMPITCDLDQQNMYPYACFTGGCMKTTALSHLGHMFTLLYNVNMYYIVSWLTQKTYRIETLILYKVQSLSLYSTYFKHLKSPSSFCQCVWLDSATIALKRQVMT